MNEAIPSRAAVSAYVPYPSRVLMVRHIHQTEAVLARLRHANLKGSGHGHLPKRRLSVQLSGCRGLVEDDRLGCGVDVAIVDFAHVLDDANEPM